MKNIKSLEKKAICEFEKSKPTWTVGDVLGLHCEWPITFILSSPVRIEWDQKQTEKEKESETNEDSELFTQQKIKEEQSLPGPYSLVVLDTVNIYPGKGVFKVTSYKPGNYNTGFTFVSDQGTIQVKPLYWQVKSVIPPEKKETIQPYPPYGPWKEALPFWYWPLTLVVLLSGFVFMAFKIWFFVKRKNKIQEVEQRLKNKTPFREFISQLNLLVRKINSTKNKEIIPQLDKQFRLFLENEFLIFALNKKPEKIVCQLKKHYPIVCKKCNFFEFFKEIEKLSQEKISQKEHEQILDMARELAISCVEREG